MESKPANHVFIGRRRIDEAAVEAGSRQQSAPEEPAALPPSTPADRRRARQREAGALCSKR
jgi:hypothetical protein